jgi:transcription elongation factor Elf1
MRKNESKLDRGFRGIYKVISEPFFDDSNVDGLPTSIGQLGSKGKKVLGKCPYCGTTLSENADIKTGDKICKNCRKKLDYHILPNRILIEPITVYEEPIDDNTAYIDRNFITKDLTVLWTMLFRKTSGEGRARSITHILPEEFNKLKKIFETVCKVSNNNTFQKYIPTNPQRIEIPLDTDTSGELKIEAFLEAWLMQNIGLKSIDGLDPIIKETATEKIEYFGNNVLYGIGGEKVDILIIYNNGKERTRALVIELKKGKIKKRDINQIKDYTKWMSQLVFGDDTLQSKKKIEPILIGFKADSEIINQAKKLITDTKDPILLEYEVKGHELKFRRVL